MKQCEWCGEFVDRLFPFKNIQVCGFGCQGKMDKVDRDDDEVCHPANANIITAAPEMLEILQQIVASGLLVLDHLGRSGIKGDQLDERARVVIRKATEG